jgi:hypothetical protein
MNWSAPYRWTIAGPAWIISGPPSWPDVPWAYVWSNRALAENFFRRVIRPEYGETSLRVVPIPFTGKG